MAGGTLAIGSMISTSVAQCTRTAMFLQTSRDQWTMVEAWSQDCNGHRRAMVPSLRNHCGIHNSTAGLNEAAARIVHTVQQGAQYCIGMGALGVNPPPPLLCTESATQPRGPVPRPEEAGTFSGQALLWSYPCPRGGGGSSQGGRHPLNIKPHAL